MSRTEKAEQFLRNIFPRAATYKDIWTHVNGPMNSIQFQYDTGGTLMKSLVNKKKAKKVSDGFYAWIPQ